MKNTLHITTITSNESGHAKLTLRESKINGLSRRVSRTATLDGGSVFVDSGFTHSDRTFDITFTGSSENKELLYKLVQTESFVRISLKEGVFIGVIQNLNTDKRISTLKFLVSEKE